MTRTELASIEMPDSHDFDNYDDLVLHPVSVPAQRPRPDRTVRRSIIALVVTALLAFAVVSTGAIWVARGIARSDAFAEAIRSAHVVGNTVFAPLLPGVIAGDKNAKNLLDAAVRIRSRDGSLVRVKVWRRTGLIIYSDDPAAMGNTFALHADVAETIDAQKSTADMSDLTDPENFTENGVFRRLVEVYVPITLDDGTKLAFELYSTDARVVDAQNRLASRLVPFALMSLLVLLITQLPVSVWLVRRVGRAQEERARLLRSSLAASARERRAIARDLHDGVVQDLAGAGYALGALARTLPENTPPAARSMVDRLGGVLQGSVGSLRTLMIDIYPPDLTADGLQAAVEDLADRLRRDDGVDVEVAITISAEPSPEVAATVYRCARECLSNIGRHAHAQHVRLTLTGDQETVRMVLTDDGVGLPPTGVDRRAEGHFGLQLLRDAAKDLGGELRIMSDEPRGTVVSLQLPSGGSFRA
jgi:two-component system NarL family sensor kinase